MTDMRKTKMDRWDLSPEEYVSLLYRTILQREPDDEGLRSHAAALRTHGDPTRIMDAFVNSEENRNSLIDKQLGTIVGAQGADRSQSPIKDHLSFVISASERHFSDIEFLKQLARFGEATPPKSGRVKNIGLYYWRMNNGGTERVTARQVLMWTKMGYNVTLITDQEADEINDYEYGGRAIKRYVIPERMMHNNYYPRRGRALADVLKIEEIDLFVTNQWYEISSVWDVLVAKSLGIPAIVGWHNVFDAGMHSVDDLGLAYLRYVGYRHADLVAVLSSVDQAWFDTCDIPTRMVHNPLTFDALPEKPASLDGHTLLWLARAEKHQKRIDHVLRMFPLVLAEVPDATLLIVGGGPDLDWAREYAHALGIGSRVNFVGYTTEVDKYIVRASVHVMTSEFEGYPMVLGEVWSHGVPTVIYDLPHLEYLRSGKGHVAVEQGNISELADAVVKLLKDPAKRRQLGAEARSIVEDLFSDGVEKTWQDIFDRIAEGKVGRVQATHVDEHESTRILVKMLGQKLLSLHRPNAPQEPMLYMPSSATIEPPRSGFVRNVRKMNRAMLAPYKMGYDALRNYLVPDTRLKMIDLSDVGLGDNLMIWAGLYTLLENGVPLCAPGCVIHVQPILAELCSRFFAPFGLVVQRGRPPEEISPFYSPMPPKTFRQWWDTYTGRDWRMNWVESTDLQKSFPRHGADRSFKAHIRLRLSERFLYRRHSWAEAMPSYIGYRVWLPLAKKHGIYPSAFLSQMKRSLRSMRQVFSQYVDEITPLENRGRYRGNSAFPVGKSFQTIPPLVFSEINRAMGDDPFTCYVQEDSAWHADYMKNGVKTESLKDIRDTFRLIRYGQKILTTDSFTSHVAQLLRDDFVLVLSRDMQESIMHPGSHPQTVANHPPCAPCNYQERAQYDTCVAGYRYCIAFESEKFVDEIGASLGMEKVR